MNLGNPRKFQEKKLLLFSVLSGMLEHIRWHFSHLCPTCLEWDLVGCSFQMRLGASGLGWFIALLGRTLSKQRPGSGPFYFVMVNKAHSEREGHCRAGTLSSGAVSVLSPELLSSSSLVSMPFHWHGWLLALLTRVTQMGIGTLKYPPGRRPCFWTRL